MKMKQQTLIKKLITIEKEIKKLIQENEILKQENKGLRRKH